MKARLPGLLCLVTGLLAGACDGGGNLLDRRDLAWIWDLGGEASREDAPAPADAEEDLRPGDPNTPDEDLTGTGQDPGRDPGTPDPGTDPSRDPGTDPFADPGTPSPATLLVTDREVRPALKEMIARARESIRLVNLSFPPGWAPDEISVALVQAAGRGVDVRVLLEDDDGGQNRIRVDVLSRNGVQARLDTASKTLHVKLLAVDRTRALVGSSNLSTSALEYNHEANLLLEAPAAAAELQRYADALWQDATGMVRVDASALPEGRLIGDGQYLAQVLPLLERATGRAWLAMYQFSSDWSGDVGDLADALIGARNRGADVRVVLEVGSFADVETANRTSGARLAAAGVAVRYDPASTITHAKLLLLDDSVAVHSGNFVYSGLRLNHEAGAVTFQADPLAEAETWFTALWNASGP
ncbi:hypothetical protein KBD49_11075 [Myxococcota bacterium]|nr:hypothetical protein [Myxococcota bacterium]